MDSRVTPRGENDTVLSSFLTAVIGGLVVLLADRVRWRRENRVRWVSPRRELYTAFLDAIDRWEELDHWAAMRGENEDWIEGPEEDRLDALVGIRTSTRLRPLVNVAAAEAHCRLTELELVGSLTMTRRARTLRDELFDHSHVRYSSPPRSYGGSSDDLVAASNGFQQERERFVAFVRRELGAN